MKNIKLDEFLKLTTNLKTGEFANLTGTAPSTLRRNWKIQSKRPEIIFLAVGVAANNGETARNLLKLYC
ncbi:hypothetical protein TUM4438_45430 [Shewanella sairae]|uniref:XRE family transcriptional regulator n=1 Tax=Shewanella sairae TaxID=190310 RepID=A0ABQ4PRS0_9GAMM|nr:hypothetical protein [Shewanella sairae]MCL1132602.1 hypothetical protein [Shewanella sairae]GIU52508.1 hypothetical protein TUM4438_45430 [Shewanella sairae]